MLLICGIPISHADFPSQRGAGVETGAGEILIRVGLGVGGGEKAGHCYCLREAMGRGSISMRSADIPSSRISEVPAG